MQAPAPPYIVFYDGTCGFCNRSVLFLLQRDRRRRLRFAPLQGATAASLLTAAQTQTLSTIVLLANGQSSERSSAVLACLRLIGGGWALIGAAGRLVPAPVRDGVYRLVAKYRHLLGAGACRLPTPEERQLFLP